MKKTILPALAALTLLASCGAGNASEPTIASSEPTVASSKEAESTPTILQRALTSLADGELYFDINLSSIPQGVSFSVGGAAVTESKKITMKQGMEFSFAGDFGKDIYIYHIIDGSSSVASGGGKQTPDKWLAYSNRIFGRFAETFYGDRVYFCITDTKGGWSKTFAGVDATLSVQFPVGDTSAN